MVKRSLAGVADRIFPAQAGKTPLDVTLPGGECFHLLESFARGQPEEEAPGSLPPSPESAEPLSPGASELEQLTPARILESPAAAVRRGNLEDLERRILELGERTMLAAAGADESVTVAEALAEEAEAQAGARALEAELEGFAKLATLHEESEAEVTTTIRSEAELGRQGPSPRWGRGPSAFLRFAVTAAVVCAVTAVVALRGRGAHSVGGGSKGALAAAAMNSSTESTGAKGSAAPALAKGSKKA